jgi:hypothetical protein
LKEKSMINLDDVTVYSDLRERLSRITPEQIDAAARKFKVNDVDAKREIGTINSYTTRALYTLWRALVAEEALEKALAGSEIEEIAEKDHLQKATLLDMFADIARELFWAQAKIDLGFYDRVCCVGLRANWLLVKEAHEGPAGFGSFIASMGAGPGGSGNS